MKPPAPLPPALRRRRRRRRRRLQPSPPPLLPPSSKPQQLYQLLTPSVMTQSIPPPTKPLHMPQLPLSPSLWTAGARTPAAPTCFIRMQHHQVRQDNSWQGRHGTSSALQLQTSVSSTGGPDPSSCWCHSRCSIYSLHHLVVTVRGKGRKENHDGLLLAATGNNGLQKRPIPFLHAVLWAGTDKAASTMLVI